MKTLAIKKLSSTLTKPMKSRRKRLSLGMLGALERSRIMKPRPPMVKRKLEASPSIIYCPFTLYARKATGLWCPCSSVIDPTLGGSTITSYMMPEGIKRLHQCHWSQYASIIQKQSYVALKSIYLAIIKLHKEVIISFRFILTHVICRQEQKSKSFCLTYSVQYNLRFITVINTVKEGRLTRKII